MAFLTVIMVGMVLYFGLRMRGAVNTNDVCWSPDKLALCFQGSGIAYIDDLPIVRFNRTVESLTIEIVVTPGQNQRQGFSPLLLLHDGVDQRQVAIWQYKDSLIVMNGNDYNNFKRWPRITGRHILQPDQIRFLTITASEGEGTRLFVNGKLVAQKKDWCLRIPSEGQPLRLVLGNSVYGHHGWIGDLYGLVIARKAISAEQVKERYDRWAVDHAFSLSEPDLPELVFKFNQQSWARMSDRANGNPLLEIPSHVIALEKKVLAIPKAYFRLNHVTIDDIIINILGFVPLGAVLFAYLGSYYEFDNCRKWIALAFCGLLSLGIELAQVWIPTRVSTLLDLILNTIGAWMGIEIMYLLRRVKKANSI